MAVFGLKWDERFLSLAKDIADWSKDPSTKVGAVIVRPDKTIASVGYNGFPRDVEDTTKRLENRDIKIALTLHAEVNAILHSKEDLTGCTLYVWPLPPCSQCAAKIIQSNIHHVVSPEIEDGSRWSESCDLGREIMIEAGLNVHRV